ncbi:hypothetical protein IEQ34_009317 [Dendrobium chrysotoxum]|uniref:Uncharacterized protein n=1 Tax=Dendrobium chrysotoxum TaxID=161865 RepID=A0AAV7GYV6_DENCH|nr:hypothetical protein IEQ34_009317 [Dendrobium chrysotoxum]
MWSVQGLIVLAVTEVEEIRGSIAAVGQIPARCCVLRMEEGDRTNPESRGFVCQHGIFLLIP